MKTQWNEHSCIHSMEMLPHYSETEQLISFLHNRTWPKGVFIMLVCIVYIRKYRRNCIDTFQTLWNSRIRVVFIIIAYTISAQKTIKYFYFFGRTAAGLSMGSCPVLSRPVPSCHPFMGKQHAFVCSWFISRQACWFICTPASGLECACPLTLVPYAHLRTR